MSTPMQTATRRSISRREKSEQNLGPGVGPTPSSTTSNRSKSPLSPAREIRLREKEEIAGLNSRLAQYIDVVRRLETENETLRVRISRSEETTTQERSHVREMYETELQTLRDENAAMMAERASVEAEKDKLKMQNTDLIPRLRELEKKNDMLTQQNRELEKIGANQEAELVKAQKDREMISEELATISLEMQELKRQLQASQEQLEVEVQNRVKAESAFNSLEKRLTFEKNVFEETLKESSILKVTEIEELERRKDSEANNRIEQLLEDLRNHHENKMMGYKQEKENYYQQKLTELNQVNTERDRELVQGRKTITDLQIDNTKMLEELTHLNEMLRNRDNKVQEIEETLMRERNKAMQMEADVRQEIDRLKDQLMQQCDEYQDLLDEKLTLDLEISAYRKMIESEEARMNITPSPGRKRKSGDASANRSKKRKLRTEEYFSSETVHSTKLIGLEVVDADPEGRFVTVQNHTNQEISLANYELRRVANDAECSYIFPPEASLVPRATVTVYSYNCAGAVHEPPHSVIADDIAAWPVAEEFLTTLYDINGEEIANRVCKRFITEEENIQVRNPQELPSCVIC